MNRILEKLFRWKWRNPPLENNKKWVAGETSTTQETEVKTRFVGGGALDAPQGAEIKNKNKFVAEYSVLHKKVGTFRLGHQMSQGGKAGTFRLGHQMSQDGKVETFRFGHQVSNERRRCS